MKGAWKKGLYVILLFTTAGVLYLAGTRGGSARAGPADLVALGTPLPTPAPTATSLVPLELPLAGSEPSRDLEAFLEAPTEPVPTAYVILSASRSQSYATDFQIAGFVNSTAFVCPGTPCKIVLQTGPSSLVFKAVGASGDTSRDVFASVRVENTAQGFLVVIESLSQFHVGADACREIWAPQGGANPDWAEFPQFASQLNTQKTLHYLVTMQILHGMVDVNDCQGGAVGTGLGWPTGCGVQRATASMIAMQNEYDANIWQAGNEIGIPPWVLKTLLEVESQFWPGNQRAYLAEFGLGQINQLGLDPLMRFDNNAFQTACVAALSTRCYYPYVREPVELQQMLRGALLNTFDATCPTCPTGLDFAKAQLSISWIARVLRADCQQTKSILQARGYSATYEDYWKFTLLSYHSGVGCLDDAVAAVQKTGEPMDWQHVARRLDCALDGQKYVDAFWADLNSFDQYRYTPGGPANVMYVPVPTPRPASQPLSHAQVIVQVYMDLNADRLAEIPELLTGIGVDLTLQDGRVLSAVTSQGHVFFDMTGYPANTVITVSLPGLYRAYSTNLPEQGIVPVVFAFQNPGLPPQLP